MSTSEIIAVSVTLLAILGKVYDFYNSKSYKEAKEEQIKAKEEKIALLNERVDFLANHNDDFLVRKYKSRVDELKNLIENTDSPDIQSQLKAFSVVISDLQTKNIELMTELEGKNKDIQEMVNDGVVLNKSVSTILRVLKRYPNSEVMNTVKQELRTNIPELERWVGSSNTSEA